MNRGLILALISSLPLMACGGEQPPASENKAAETAKAPAVKPPVEPPTPVQDTIEDSPRPSLLLAQAWFWKDENGKSNPGPARLEIWRKGDDGKWGYKRLEDGDSNVFHKAMPFRDGILTIGAEGARLKHWTLKDGTWSGRLLWEQSWGGKFQRLRDVEIGDVDHDGEDEIVIATHDAGVVAVADVIGDGPDFTVKVTELDQKADTFVHEIEIGDIDGDGKDEFFCTPSDRNKANASQSGGVAMYKYDGSKYVRTWVDHEEGTHAKEILTTDLDGDGVDELYGVMEAEVDPKNKKKLLKPVRIKHYLLQPDGSFTSEVVAEIQDRQTRFLVPADYNYDGKLELMAMAMKTGIFYINPHEKDGEMWAITQVTSNSGGFEHAAYADDLDGDGKVELYVAADDQGELRAYRYNEESGKFDSELLGTYAPKKLFTWNVTTAVF